MHNKQYSNKQHLYDLFNFMLISYKCLLLFFVFFFSFQTDRR